MLSCTYFYRVGIYNYRFGRELILYRGAVLHRVGHWRLRQSHIWEAVPPRRSRIRGTVLENMRRQWRSLFSIHGLQPQVMEPQCAEPGPLGDRSCRLRLQYGSLPRQRVRFYTNNGIANFQISLDLDFTPASAFQSPFSNDWLWSFGTFKNYS